VKLSDLRYEYPESLVATLPQKDFRILSKAPDRAPEEWSRNRLLESFQPGDLLIINDTKVEKRRVFSGEIEIVFIEELAANRWSVLFPAKKMKLGGVLPLPGGIEARLVEKGLPQVLETSQAVTAAYFEAHGEPALPPYIQKARGRRHAEHEDARWYQTDWAREAGSVAAPTASLHFTSEDFHRLRRRGVHVEALTLHVGLGTFLPVKTEDLRDHRMHSEKVAIPKPLIKKIQEAQAKGAKISALGTTVCRSLESWALGLLNEGENDLSGETRLFIMPGFEFRVVDRLLTNFHQPESTLLALVAGFAGLDEVKAAYDWAVERKFRLFSYGDLSVWNR
jgi:S-adenosylmethionine:tRNA ribosyltransferase-isomerase